ncbi:unnamed protein product [Candida verbasci]|uniref:Signal recognition particle subunit SRP14 n=1 Tax=Candida verbasci TaxID=1227364 RepID=A0A9W4TXY8_9ASCO|nr:unnamed protein product [Candida verbasci]
MTKRVNTPDFLQLLQSQLQNSKGKKSIYLTQKRLSSNIENSINDLPSNVISTPIENNETYPILLRFSQNSSDNKINKDRVKYSTIIESDKLDEFWQEYLKILKNGFIGLKKKEKKKSKKGKK